MALQHIQTKPKSAGVIISLHANKPRGMGNMYDEKQSLTTTILHACREHVLPASVEVLVLEAMPLQQFPIGYRKAPFRHPQHYPRKAWAIGRLILSIQLAIVRNSMLQNHLDASAYFKVMVACGRWACARFCCDNGPNPGYKAQPVLTNQLNQSVTGTTHMPCISTCHPAALPFDGLTAAEQLVSGFQQAAAIINQTPISQFLEPVFVLNPKPNMIPWVRRPLRYSHQALPRPAAATRQALPKAKQLLKDLTRTATGTLSHLLNGHIGLASIANGRYVRPSAVFIQSKLKDLPALPSQARLQVGRITCPSDVPISMTKTYNSAGLFMQVSGLHLPYLLQSLRLSSKQAVLKLLDDGRLHVCVSSEHTYTAEQLEEKHVEAHGKMQVRLHTCSWTQQQRC